MLRGDVTSITLAELTLLLLFVVIIIMFISSPSMMAENDEPNLIAEQKAKIAEQKAKIGELEAKIAEQDVRIDTLETDLKRARRQIATLSQQLERAGLRSKLIPPCSELNIGESYLCTIKVLDSDKFMVSDEIYSFEELKLNLNDALTIARHAECLYRVRVTFDRNLTAEQYNNGLRKIRTTFYTRILSGQ